MSDPRAADSLNYEVRIAEQKFESRLDRQTTDNFKELGVYTVAFVVFTRPNGQLGMAT